MKPKAELLWPWGIRAALLAAVVIWLSLIVILASSQAFLDWSKVGASYVLLAVVTIGLLPLGLCLIDRIIQSRAVVSFKDFKIDFGQAQISRTSIELPINAGRPEPVVADSSPMEIVSALETATSHQVVRLDLHDGSAWWVTRLLALCAGAVHSGSPKVIVFLGVKENVGGAFLGWSTTAGLINAFHQDPQGRGPA